MTQEEIKQQISLLFSSREPDRKKALRTLTKEPLIRFNEFQLFRDNLLEQFGNELEAKISKPEDDKQFIIDMAQQIPKIWFQTGTQISSICLSLMKDVCNKIYEVQINTGIRVHKGLILHNIGWVYFFAGDKQTAEGYFIQAFIEDSITHEGDPDTPANKFLTQYYNYPKSELSALRKCVRVSIATDVKRSNYPDICYLDYVVDGETKRSKFFVGYNKHAGKYLLNQVKEARKSSSSSEKGNSFELLIMYLFMTSVLFDVRKNLRSETKEIDLLIKTKASDQALFNLFGDYLLVEAKNRKNKTDAPAVKKSIVTLQHSYALNGIFISYVGFTKPALKILHDEFIMNKRVVIPLDIDDVEEIIEEKINLIEKLIAKYEELRFMG